MRRLNIWSVVLVTLLFTACTENDDGTGSTSEIDVFQSDSLRLTSDQIPGAASSNVLPAHHDYSFSEFDKYNPVYKNSLLAPFDWQQFMSMLALGSKGTTRDVFSNVTKIDFNRTDSFADISIWEQEVTLSDGVEINRHLWGQSHYLFSTDFLQAQADLFGPNMSALDFRFDTNQASSIIEEMFDNTYLGLDDRTRLVLTQTVNISSTWSAGLMAEAVIARFGMKTFQHWVDMTRIEGLLNVYQGSNFKAVQIPFETEGLSLLLITPADGHYQSVSRGLNSEFWNQVIDNLSPVETSVYVPAFNLEHTSTEEELSLFGIALSDTGADFSFVNNVGFLYLQESRQKSSLSVGSSGVLSTTHTSAVVRAIENEPLSLFNSNGFTVTVEYGPDYTVFLEPVLYDFCLFKPDQSPFIFAIFNEQTQSILRLGQMVYIEGDVVMSDWSVPDYKECGNEPPVEIYKYKGSLQCDTTSGVNYWDMEQILLAEGIEVVQSGEQNDNLIRPQVCGAPDGVINVFSVRAGQLADAQALGFNLLSDLIQ